MAKKYNNIILFATYWNEKDWIETSLKQIEKLNPKEVIICDGCFDPKKVNKSTDGTREVIKKWVSKRDNTRMISAIRVPKWKGFFMIAKAHKKIAWHRFFTPSRLKSLYLTLVVNEYRVNQALTFQKFISMSKKWRVGDWVTNYDCDQFYSDDMLKTIIKTINNKTPKNIGMITGDENTFPDNFKFYTTQYEKRNYNNMPHKIYKETNIMPTRATVLDSWSFASINPKKFFKGDFYTNRVKEVDAGYYNHYKFKFDKKRLMAGYNLGDRKAPNMKGYKIEKYTDKHPKVVEGIVKKHKK